MTEKERKTVVDESTTELSQNVAGLLCYLAGWITGIIFLVIEKKNRFVRFHAMQSIVVFGVLTVATGMLSSIPYVGGFFGAAIGILGFILWLVLIIRAYQGELYKFPVAGDVAMAILTAIEKGGKTKTVTAQESTETATSEPIEPSVSEAPKKGEDFGKRMEEYFTLGRAGRITGYSFAILWNVAFFIFLTFFHKYIAAHITEADGSVTRISMLTDDYFTWLPILITVTILAIIAYIVLIIYDKYPFRGIVQIFTSIIGVAAVVSLVSIFPFDFSVIPNDTAVDAVPNVVMVVLILAAIGLGIGALTQFIKLISHASKQNSG
jgi:uncharacterized membrane protein